MSLLDKKLTDQCLVLKSFGSFGKLQLQISMRDIINFPALVLENRDTVYEASRRYGSSTAPKEATFLCCWSAIYAS